MNAPSKGSLIQATPLALTSHWGTYKNIAAKNAAKAGSILPMLIFTGRCPCEKFFPRQYFCTVAKRAESLQGCLGGLQSWRG